MSLHSRRRPFSGVAPVLGGQWETIGHRDFVPGWSNQGATLHCALYALNNTLGEAVFAINNFAECRPDRATNWGDDELHELLTESLTGDPYKALCLDKDEFSIELIELFQLPTLKGYVVNVGGGHWVSIAYDNGDHSYARLDSQNAQRDIILTHDDLLTHLLGIDDGGRSRWVIFETDVAGMLPIKKVLRKHKRKRCPGNADQLVSKKTRPSATSVPAV